MLAAAWLQILSGRNQVKIQVNMVSGWYDNSDTMHSKTKKMNNTHTIKKIITKKHSITF